LYNPSDIKNVCDLLFVYQHNFIHSYVVLLSGTEIARSGAQGYSDNCETGCFVFLVGYIISFKLSRVKNLCCFFRFVIFVQFRSNSAFQASFVWTAAAAQ